MNTLTRIEKKLKEKSLDLQKREKRIVNLEEDLKHKVQEISSQLTSKEEEIMTLRQKFKEDKVQLETDKKKLNIQLEKTK